MAREVVEAAGGDIRTRVVGTGPFRLREWRRGSRLVLEANPGYRDVRFPQSDDPALAGLVRGAGVAEGVLPERAHGFDDFGENWSGGVGVEVNAVHELILCDERHPLLRLARAVW